MPLRVWRILHKLGTSHLTIIARVSNVCPPEHLSRVFKLSPQLDERCERQHPLLLQYPLNSHFLGASERTINMVALALPEALAPSSCFETG